MKKKLVFIIIGIVLIGAALSLVGYNFYTDREAGIESETVLEELNAAMPKERVDVPAVNSQGEITQGESSQGESLPEEEGEISYPDYILNPSMDMPEFSIDGNPYIGMISLPTLGLELPVLSEWSYPNLRIAPCRLSGSVYLDDMILIAHSYASHFRYIRDLLPSDPVMFTDGNGNVFHFTVTETDVILPTALDSLDKENWDLLLITCTPSGEERVVVQCRRD